MSDPIRITRSVGSFSSFEFTDDNGSLPIAGMLTVHDDTDLNVFYLVDQETRQRLISLTADQVSSLNGILTAAINTLSEITITDEELDHARRNS